MALRRSAQRTTTSAASRATASSASGRRSRRRAAGRWPSFERSSTTGFESIETFVKLSAYWHHFCAPQFNSRNVKWLCHFPDMWWCAATGPIVHRGRDELTQRDQEVTISSFVGPAASGPCSQAISRNQPPRSTTDCHGSTQPPRGSRRSRVGANMHLFGSAAAIWPFSSTAPKPAPRQPPRRGNTLPMRKFDPQRSSRRCRASSGSITQWPTRGCKPLPTSSDGDRWTTWSSTTPRLAVQGDGNFGSCAKKLAACWHVCPRVHSLGSVRALVQTNVTGAARASRCASSGGGRTSGRWARASSCSARARGSRRVRRWCCRASARQPSTPPPCSSTRSTARTRTWSTSCRSTSTTASASCRRATCRRRAARSATARRAARGRVGSSSTRAMRTTASRAHPRCDGRRASERRRRRPASPRCRSRRTRRSASSTTCLARGRGRRRAAAAAGAGRRARRDHRLPSRRVGGGGAAGARRLRGGRRGALRPQLRCLSLEGTDHFGQPWRRGGGVPLDKGGTATRAVCADGAAPRRPPRSSQSSCTPTRRRCRCRASTFALELSPPATAAEASPEFFRPERRARLAWLDSTRGHDDDALLRWLPPLADPDGEKRLCAQAPRRCARVAIAPQLGLPGLPTNLTAAGRTLGDLAFAARCADGRTARVSKVGSHGFEWTNPARRAYEALGSSAVLAGARGRSCTAARVWAAARRSSRWRRRARWRTTALST